MAKISVLVEIYFSLWKKLNFVQWFGRWNLKFSKLEKALFGVIESNQLGSANFFSKIKWGKKTLLK